MLGCPPLISLNQLGPFRRASRRELRREGTSRLSEREPRGAPTVGAPAEVDIGPLDPYPWPRSPHRGRRCAGRGPCRGGAWGGRRLARCGPRGPSGSSPCPWRAVGPARGSAAIYSWYSRGTLNALRADAAPAAALPLPPILARLETQPCGSAYPLCGDTPRSYRGGGFSLDLWCQNQVAYPLQYLTGRGAEYRPLGTPQGPFFTEAGGRTLGKHPFLISRAYYCDINYKIQGAMGWQPGADGVATAKERSKGANRDLHHRDWS